MPCILPNYKYDTFISYCQNDSAQSEHNVILNKAMIYIYLSKTHN